MATYKKIFLKDGKERTLSLRHPWIFSGAISRVAADVEDGEFVRVCDKSGSELCSGHYSRGNTIAVRVLSFDKVASEEYAIAYQLSRAVAMRENLGFFSNPQTNAFRLVHGEGDSLPGLVVDLYRNSLVVQCHTSSMFRLRYVIAKELQKLLPLHSETVYVTRIYQIKARPQEADLLENQVASEKPLNASLNAEASDIVDVKLDKDGRGELIYGSATSTEFKENGIVFFANWAEGQKTGFFLDQRSNRQLVAEYAKGRKVLDAFCYSGGFTLSALSGGARATCSVDAASSAIELLRNHLDLNGFDMSQGGAQKEQCVGDCFRYLATMPLDFDLVILDPPAFVKHQKALERGLRGYETINFYALKNIRKGGLVFTFSCSQLVSKEEFRKRIFLAGQRANREVRVIRELEQAPCHPVSLYHREGAYLKGLLLYVE